MKKSTIAPTIGVFLLTLFMLNTHHSILAQTSSNNITISKLDNTSRKTIVYKDSEGLSLSEPNTSLKKIDIFNKQGRKLLSITKFDKKIYLRSLKPGAYHITIELKTGEIILKKLIKP